MLFSAVCNIDGELIAELFEKLKKKENGKGENAWSYSQEGSWWELPSAFRFLRCGGGSC
mgnify:FL=1